MNTMCPPEEEENNAQTKPKRQPAPSKTTPAKKDKPKK